MNINQQKSNTDKSVNGNTYEKILTNKLRKATDKLKINRMNRQKKFYYAMNTPEEEIAEMIKKAKKDGSYTKRTTDLIINQYIEKHNNKLIRDNKKYYKRADITFKTVHKYFYNGKLTDIRIIIDTTTSARGDRIKAKAQDALVYNTFNFPYIYLIVLPNDHYFIEKKYANPENEAKFCKNIIYDNNFCNLYKEEKVSLVLQEKDLFAFLTYISKRKEQDINKLIENFKKYNFKDMYQKRKEDKQLYAEQLKNEVLKLL